MFVKTVFSDNDAWTDFMEKPLPYLLPPNRDVESKLVLRRAAAAHRKLAELKGVLSSMPNKDILINTLTVHEAKESSEIENIITTHDEVYRQALSDKIINTAAKEVQNYAVAVMYGYQIIQNRALLTANDIKQIQSKLELNEAGFRKLPGTEIVNDNTGKTVYTPPQDHSMIVEYMENLERFINDDNTYDADPLVKMAIIHYQFESIHPFYDGNGRTGRIINVLYLVLKKLLDIPVLYLSGYITAYKDRYYKLIQRVHDSEDWESWILYMLSAVEQTSDATVKTIKKIRSLMQEYKQRIKGRLSFYSQDLLNCIFSHPYTKIEFVERDLLVSRKTAGQYLNRLCQEGLLEKKQLGRTNYYLNRPLYEIFLPDEGEYKDPEDFIRSEIM